MNRIRILSGLIVIGAVAGPLSADAATGMTVGADEGHGPATTCGLQPFNLTPSVSCSNPAAPSSSGNNWQIPLRTPTSTAVTATLTAGASAFVPGQHGGHPNANVFGRLLAWNTTGILVCATAGATWNQASGMGGSKNIGSCTQNWLAMRAEAEFGIGHIVNNSGVMDPQVQSVTFLF